LVSVLSTSQVNFLKGEDWEAAKELSVKTGKPIFIDFYTTWCGPCKLMDKSTFKDSSIIVLLNEKFVSLKLDAEREINRGLVKSYKINSYPTSLFISGNGELIAKEIGYKSAAEFIHICANLFGFINEEHNSKLSDENINNISNDELDKILSKYLHFNFDAKAAIKNRLYKQLKQDGKISIVAFQYLIFNYEKNDEYFLLTNLIPDKISIFDDFHWQYEFDAFYEKLFIDAIKNGDKAEFDDISNNYLTTFEKLQKSNTRTFQQDPLKEIRVKTLSFYFRNKQLEEYFILADSLINEYIMPHTAENVKSSDEFNMKMSEFILDPLEEEEDKPKSIRDSLYIKNVTSFRYADRLNEISENVVHLLAQEDKLLKALAWMNRSIEYIDLPESRIIKAAILKSLGKEQESKTELLLAKESIYFDESCDKKITALNL